MHLDKATSYQPGPRQISPAIFSLIAITSLLLGCSKISQPKVNEQPRSEANYEHALDLYLRGEYKASLEDFNRALIEDPNNKYAYLGRGNAWARIGNFKQAVGDYEQALKIDPSYASAYNNRGNSRLDAGDFNGAMEDFNRALELNPKLPYVYSDRGTLRSNLGDNKGAIADYNEAIRLDPEYAGAYLNRACSRAALGQDADAISDYRKARRLDSQKIPFFQDPLRELKRGGKKSVSNPKSIKR